MRIFTIAAMAANIVLWWALAMIPPAAFGWIGRETFYALAGTALCAAAIAVIRAEWPGPGGAPGTGSSTGTGSGGTEGVRPSLGAITAIAVAFAGAILLAGVVAGSIKPLTAAMALLLGGGAFFAILASVDRLAAGSEVEVSSHWGGLGGSLGGWRVSQTAILILVALILVSASVVASGGLKEGDGDRKDKTAEKNEAAGPENESEATAPGNEATGNESANIAVDANEAVTSGGNAAATNSSGNEATSGPAITPLPGGR